MIAILSAICGGFLAGWILGRSLCPRLRRGSNPPPPGRKPPAPASPPRPTMPFVGHHRWFINNPVQIAECGGPCSAGPSHCDCGALWVDVPIRLDEGTVQRGNGSGGPTTPKPRAIPPKPQPPPGRIVDVHGMTIGYIPLPRPQGGTPNPPPSDP